MKIEAASEKNGHPKYYLKHNWTSFCRHLCDFDKFSLLKLPDTISNINFLLYQLEENTAEGH